MRVFGLTGGVATGKSEVAAVFANKGIPVVDTDPIAHHLLDKNEKVQTEVEETFGTLDRHNLRQVVFSDPEKRKKLENILHPPIWREVEDQLQSLEEQEDPPDFVLIVVPLLYETKSQNRVDRVVAVICPERTQLERLVERDGISSELAQAMMKAQMPNREKQKRADFLIKNDTSLETLRKQTENLIDQLTIPG